MKKSYNIFSNQQGSVFVLVGVFALLLVIASGAAIDMTRAQTLQARISSSLDAAGLAAGATAASGGGVQAQATRYFNANFPSGYLGAGTVTLTTSCADISDNPISCTSLDVYRINLAASTSQATDIMDLVGINTVNVAATSQITRQNTGIELVLLLDNTGSMGGAVNGNSVTNTNPAKITALKCALAGDASFSGVNTTCETNNLVTIGLLDILYGSNTSLPDLFVGVVPFSDMVNMNVTAAPASSFVNNVTSGNKASMGGCISSRSFTTNSTTDSGITLPTGDVSLTLDISDDPPSASNANSYFQALTSSGNSNCPTAAQPMSSNKSDAIATIKKMNANGNTMIQLGFAWGWRMLSPNWTGLWGSSPTFTYPSTTNTVSLPLPYNTQQMQKVAILMTDGQNTVPSYGINSGSGNNVTMYLANSAYDLLLANGTSSGGWNPNYTITSNPVPFPNTTTQLDNLTKTTCDAMKSKGIIIYTIGFGTNNVNPVTDVNTALLQYCATQNYVGDTSHFFLAPTNTQLTSAFQQIGDQLANLRISQ